MSDLPNNLHLALWVSTALIFAVLLIPRISYRKKESEHLPYPPGPQGLPIIGSILQMPQKDQWHTFAEWARKYGNIIHLTLLDRHVVILTSYEDADRLLNARGAIYSSRPRLTLFRQHAGWDKLLGILPYGESLHTQRRMLNGFFNPSASRKYHPLLEHHSRLLALQLSEDSSKLDILTRLHVSAVILRITYGHKAESEDDEWIHSSEAAMKSFDALGVPGSHAIDIFPALGRLPYWIWGTRFIQALEGLRKGAFDLSIKPFATVKDQSKSGNAEPSIAARLIEENASNSGTCYDERDMSGACGSIYAAGVDANDLLIHSFILAMAVYPEVQRKAQAELDHYLRNERLPNVGDRNSLPYLTAVAKEVLRYRPIAPLGEFDVRETWSVCGTYYDFACLGFPHATEVDDEYEKMLIPAGSMIITDMTMCHDPHDFPDPFLFNPDRFLYYEGGAPSLRKDVREPEDIVFGFGRRICIGRHIAMAQLWIIITTFLATFEIGLPHDEAGKEIRPTKEHFDQIERHPKPFPFQFVPRSKSVIHALRDAVSSAE
ncbi:cytochrome P450 [Sistotremastrum niveocremeum HHB9708]|uniref:Cytochrome P450 n=1 Tax=Sistotremastrum niveocremeum HHB9708 TaxID=1314777 RepID=A0A164TXS4_9AGAM|nr:cytochrome P450 [Sistotremastrum niveocremeum HHB9708]